MSQIETIRRVLDEYEAPSWVVRFEPELITDADGDDAVAVWVVMQDREFDQNDLGTELNALRVRVHAALRDAGIDLWPYLRFVSEADAAAAP